MNVYIVYSSPAGSTKKIAGTIGKKLVAEGHAVSLFDLGNSTDAAFARNKIMHDTGRYSLFIGSPVYACHAVPPVTAFIAGLPQTQQGYAVPFVTWGCVNSGLALYEMGAGLAAKGYRIPGAAALPAVHSMLWQSEHPLGEGRPDTADLTALQKFTAAVCEKVLSGTGAMIAPEALDYQPGPVRATMQNISLEGVRGVLPAKTVDAARCTQCGMCATICPAAAITLSPWPVFGTACFLCYNCVRLCPEQAIAADFSQMEAGLRQRAATFNENNSPKFIF
jgi:ferredoxin